MDQTDIAAASQTQAQLVTLLCVDDEANILSALKRLFRPCGYRVLTAPSGEQGLKLLGEAAVDLVISDMRMPEMDGARFLEQVRERWPDTMRILLTGYSDITSTIAAVNRGEIYRYVSKPWVDDDVVMVVRQALELKGLEREKARLVELTRQQNLELAKLNAGLENIVAQRTAALNQALDSLGQAHQKLKKSFLTSITVFSNLIDLRQGTAAHSRRVADLARRLAQRLKVGDSELQDITVAALLRDIGKLALPDRLVTKPVEVLNLDERREFTKHPVKGQAALMALAELAGAARLIRSQHERYDGMGYPDRLSGAAIPQGARILAVASDYDGLQRGLVTNRCLTPTQAQAFIVDGRGKRYDPDVVDVFVDTVWVTPGQPAPVAEEKITPARLKSGMVLTRDLVTRDGILLLSRDYVLDAALIANIRGYEENDANPVNVYVRAMNG